MWIFLWWVPFQFIYISSPLVTICIGDSKAGQLSTPKQFMKAVKRWLQSQFNGTWVNKDNSLLVGTRYDGNSCAICTINAIAHAIFENQLWEQKSMRITRAEWFLTLVNSHMDGVCIKTLLTWDPTDIMIHRIILVLDATLIFLTTYGTNLK